MVSWPAQEATLLTLRDHLVAPRQTAPRHSSQSLGRMRAELIKVEGRIPRGSTALDLNCPGYLRIQDLRQLFGFQRSSNPGLGFALTMTVALTAS